MILLNRNAIQDDKSLIKIGDLLRILAKFRLKLSDNQKVIIQKLYRVLYVSDSDVISIYPLLDLEKQKLSNEIYNNYRLEETNEELKMDLAGYVGDFHRHRIGGEEIKKRVNMTED